MTRVVRPAPAATPAGLLGYEQFQIAYVTNDLARAQADVGARYGIRNWSLVDAGTMRIALAWINGQQIELIETAGNEPQPLYDDWIDRNGVFTIRHHHFGYFIHTDEQWAGLRRHVVDAGLTIWMDIETEALKVIYVMAPELGHFLEYIYPNDLGRRFFESVVAN